MGRVKKRFKVWNGESGLYSQKGATTVEFAIVCPLLILLLFAMVEFGLYLFNRQVITNACREGARAGIVARADRVSNAEIEQIVHSYSDQHLVTFGTDDTLTVSLLRFNDAVGGHQDRARERSKLTLLILPGTAIVTGQV